jgi:hypothetical protein
VNRLASGLAERTGAVRIGQQRTDGIREGGGVVGFAEESAAGGLEEFGERGGSRLDNGNPCGERFDEIESEGFAVGGGDGKDGERLEKGDFGSALEVGEELGVGLETGVAEFLLEVLDEGSVGGAATAADAQAEGAIGMLLFEEEEGVDEGIEPFLRAHASEVAEGGCFWGGRLCWVKPIEVDAVMHDANAVGLEMEALGHELSEIVAGGDEQIYIGGSFGEGLPGAFAVRRWHGVEEGVFALEIADDAGAEMLFELAGEADEEGIGEADDVGCGSGPEPGDELFEFAGLVAFLTAKHGEGEFTDVGGASFGSAPCGPSKEGGGIEPVTEPVGGATEEGGLLLEKDIDSAEEDGDIGGLVGFVESEREVKRHHDCFMAELAPFGDEGIIAEAITAIHASGSGSDLDDVHGG